MIALAVVERRSDDANATPVPTGAVAHRAAAGTRRSPHRAGRPATPSAPTCGLILTGKSLGVSHPVLPCGAKLLLRFGTQTVLTEVIDNKLKSPGHQFELTERLAADLGIDGTQQIDWRFAARPSS